MPPQSEISGCEVTLVTEPDDLGVIEGSPCDDLIIAGEGTGAVESGAGNDLIVGAEGVGSIDAGIGDDVIYANDSRVLIGGADDDTLFGGTPSENARSGRVFSKEVQMFEEEVGRAAVVTAMAESKNEELTVFVADPVYGHSYGESMFGGAGNDDLFGLGGDDRLFGNTGDDELHGDDGDDLVAGNHGADLLEGGVGSDWTRGDGTQDRLVETTAPNAGDKDTLSYGLGVTPGFSSPSPGKINFPATSEDRGVYLKLPYAGSTLQVADNGAPGNGGGLDTTSGSTDLTRFERFVGTPFADYIVGSDNDDVIFGGGGPDVILGKGGNDTINGGATGDNIDGGTGTNTINGDASLDYCVNGTMTNCNEAWTISTAVVPRDASKVAVGFNTEYNGNTSDESFLQLYVKGSSGNDTVSATYVDPGGSTDWVDINLSGGATLDIVGLEDTSGCAVHSTTYMKCQFGDDHNLDSIVMAGMDGSDALSIGSGFPLETSAMLLGGSGNDTLIGNSGYDQLVDNAGDDTLLGGGLDDGLINGAGSDDLYAGSGNDLMLSTEICQSFDYLHGGSSTEENNASWLQTPGTGTVGVSVDLPNSEFGLYTPGVGTTCDGSTSSPKIGQIVYTKNLEGTFRTDKFVGGGSDNNLLGWGGADVLSGASDADVLMGYNPSSSSSVGFIDDDSIYGGPDNDTLRLFDGQAEDSVDCGTGSNDNGNRDSVDWNQVNATGTCEAIVLGP